MSRYWIGRAGAALAVVVVLTGSFQAAEPLGPGDPAPDFALPGSDGKTYKLADFKGKQAVVLAWFPKAFTSGCTAECKSLKDGGKAVRAFDVAYFTASCDEPGTNEKFAKELELDYPVLSDPSRSTAEAYGVVNENIRWARRWTFYIGPDGKILAIDKAVHTATHAKDIAAKLKELGIKPGKPKAKPKEKAAKPKEKRRKPKAKGPKPEEPVAISAFQHSALQMRRVLFS